MKPTRTWKHDLLACSLLALVILVPGIADAPMTNDVPLQATQTFEAAPERNLVSLGTFRITHYCVEEYHHICNNGNARTTATGNRTMPHYTVAVDPRVIPLGTRVWMNGYEYLADDTGGAIRGKRLDICVNTHVEANRYGVKYYEVFIEREGTD